MYRKEDYCRLHVGWTKDESPIWIETLRATADHYGWSTAERYKFKQRPSYLANGWDKYWRCTYRTFFPRGGTRLRICRSPSTAGFPAGLTNSVRVSEHVTNFDIAELAYLAQGDWYWLSDRTGRRISRERWLERYQIGLSSRQGTPTVTFP